MLELNGKVALVTGGSGGIGHEICRLLGEAGAVVYVNYFNNTEGAQQTIADIMSAGGQAEAVRADITDEASVAEMTKGIVEKHGKIDILVNNAGLVRDRTLAKMDSSEWDKVIDVNLTGSYKCTKAVIPSMVNSDHGKIIFVSSVIGSRGGFGQCNYAASKAGMIALAKSLALELAAKGIQVNCVAPGFTDTSMLAGIPEPVKEKIIKQIPMGRLCAPREVAESVLFLASPMSNMITGQVLAINGGLYM